MPALSKWCQSVKSETLFFENHYQRIIQWNVSKNDLLLFAIKLAEEVSDPCNAKEQYQSFIRKEKTKSVKQ